MTDALWRTIGAHYRAWAGIGLGERRREPVLVALATLAAELGHADPAALLAAAAHPDGAAVRDRVIARISVGLTWFTREQALLEPALAQAHAHAQRAALDRVAVWSAGCSTGEEPYAIAMALRVEHGVHVVGSTGRRVHEPRCQDRQRAVQHGGERRDGRRARVHVRVRPRRRSWRAMLGRERSGSARHRGHLGERDAEGRGRRVGHTDHGRAQARRE